MHVYRWKYWEIISLSRSCINILLKHWKKMVNSCFFLCSHGNTWYEKVFVFVYYYFKMSNGCLIYVQGQCVYFVSQRVFQRKILSHIFKKESWGWHKECVLLRISIWRAQWRHGHSWDETKYTRCPAFGEGAISSNKTTIQTKEQGSY